MRKIAVIALVVMASVVLAASVMAQSAVKDECVALCKDAAKFMNEKGFYPAVCGDQQQRKGSSLRKTPTYSSWTWKGICSLIRSTSNSSAWT